MRRNSAPGAAIGIDRRSGPVLDARQVVKILKLLADFQHLLNEVEVIAVADAVEEIDLSGMVIFESVLHDSDQRSEPAVPTGQNQSSPRIANLVRQLSGRSAEGNDLAGFEVAMQPFGKRLSLYALDMDLYLSRQLSTRGRGDGKAMSCTPLVE